MAHNPQYKDENGVMQDIKYSKDILVDSYKINDCILTTGSTNGVYVVNNTSLPSTLYDGLTIKVCLHRSYNSTANSLNLNGTGDKIMWLRYGTRLTSHYAQWSILSITYKTSASGSAYSVPSSPARSTSGTSVTDGWVVENIYDSNTTSTLSIGNAYWILGKDVRLNGYGLFGLDKDEVIQSFGAYGTSASTTIRTISQGDRLINSNGIDWRKGIFYSPSSSNYPVSTTPTRVSPIRLWAASTAYVVGDYVLNSYTVYKCKTAHTSGSSFSATNWTSLYNVYNSSPNKAVTGIDLRYTFNCVASNNNSNLTLGLRLGKNIYLRGYLKDDLFYFAPLTVTYNSANYYKAWTQDIPTQEETITVDSVTYPIVYWLMGCSYYNASYIPNLYQVSIYQDNPLYWFKDGEFKEYDIFTTSAASGITSNNISNWNTAYSWGNHSTQNYLKSITSSMVIDALGYTPGTSNFSGDYNDLSNKPTIPAAQIQSDWNQTNTSALDYIKNKPSSLPASDVYDWAKAATKPSYTASEVGLGNVGNFKAVSTVASQGLTDTEKSNARANIGAGTSSLTLGTTSTTAAYGNHNHDGVYLTAITKAMVENVLTGTITSHNHDGVYLKSFTETDPVFSASAAAGITSGDITNWNNKQNSISDLSTIRSNASNGNTAYGWGNHANAGYLTSHQSLANCLKNNENGTIIGDTGDTPLNLKSQSTNAFLGFKDSSGTALGYLGVNSSKKPVFYDSSSHELAYKSDLSGYLPLSGGTLTGNVTGKYFTGTWLQSTAATDLGSSNTLWVESSGWLYKRSTSGFISDHNITTGLTLWKSSPGATVTISGDMDASSTQWYLILGQITFESECWYKGSQSGSATYVRESLKLTNGLFKLTTKTTTQGTSSRSAAMSITYYPVTNSTSTSSQSPNTTTESTSVSQSGSGTYGNSATNYIKYSGLLFKL